MRIKAFVSVFCCCFISAQAFAGSTPAELAQKINTLPYLQKDLSKGYAISEHEVLTALPANAVQQGVKAAAGYLVERPQGLYRTVLVNFAFFDEPKRAYAYFQHSLADEDGVIVTHDEDIALSGLPTGTKLSNKVQVSCSVIEEQGYSLNCAIYESKIPAVVSFLMTPGINPSQRANDEEEVIAVWRVSPPDDAFQAIIPSALDQLAHATVD